MSHADPDRFKTIDEETLFSDVTEGREQQAIAFLKRYRLTDLLFLHGTSTHVTHYLRHLPTGSFIEAVVEVHKLNLLQLAVHLNLPALADFVLTKVEPRSVLLGTEFDDDETFSLRLALSRGCEAAARAIWASKLFTTRHAMVMARFVKIEPKWAPWLV